MKITFVAVHDNRDLLQSIWLNNDFRGDNIYFPIYESNLQRFQNKYPGHNVETFNNIVGNNVKEVASSAPYLYDFIKNHNENIGDSSHYIFFYIPIANEQPCEELILTYLYSLYTNKKIIIYSNKKQLIEQLEFRNPKSITVIMPVEHFNMKEHYDISKEYNKIQIGYVFYENKYVLNYHFSKLMIFANETHQGKHIIINRISEPDQMPIEKSYGIGKLYYFPKPYCTYEVLQDILLSNSSVLELNYLSHCRECALFFSKFILCGNQNDTVMSGYSIEKGKYQQDPCCYYDSESCSIEGRLKENVSSLNADILFLNGCNVGDMNNSIIPYSFTVISNLINNNAVSIITSPSIKTGHIAENVLTHNLLQNGYSEGKKLYYINKFVEYSQIEDSLYFLIGDPCIQTLNKDTYSLAKAALKQELRGNGFTSIEVKGIKGKTFLEVLLDEEGKTEDLYVHSIDFSEGIAKNVAENIFFLVTEEIESKRVKLMIFSLEEFGCESVKITLSIRNETKLKINRINTYIQNMLFYKDNFTLNSVINGSIEDIRNNIKAIYPLYKECKFSYQAMKKFQQIIDKLERRADTIFKEIFKNIVQYTSNKLDNYYENICEKRLAVKDANLHSRCMNCKNEEHIYAYKIHTFDGENNRYSCKCFNCGLIRDIPDENLLFDSYGSLKFTDDNPECEITKITNKHGHPIQISIAPICIDTKDIEVDPLVASVSLMPDETYTFKFNFKPRSPIKSHYYLFLFYIMADGKFYFYSKMFGYVRSKEAIRRK